MKPVSIILVNWNGWRDTIECLESLLQLDYPDFRIVVCDNGSYDDSLQQIRQWAQGRELVFVEYACPVIEADGDKDADAALVLIHTGSNLGFAGGSNVGLRYALARGDADYYWLLNNDTVVERGALTHLVRRMQEDQSLGMCGSTLRLYHDHDQVQALGGGYYCRWIGLPWHYGRFGRWPGPVEQHPAELWMNYVEGASMLVSRHFLEQIGLMSEEYFLYFEEADWAIRAEGRFRLGYAPQSVVYHKVGGSIGTSSNPARKSELCDYYSIRNRIMFTRRHYPAALPTVYLVLIIEVMLRLLCGRPGRAVMILRLMLRGGSDLAHRP